MTAKRFTFADGFKIVAVRDNGEIMNSVKVVDMLNALNDENKQLKHRLAISEKANFVTTLEKEIEQLKKKNKELEYHLNNTEKELQEYKDFMSLG